MGLTPLDPEEEREGIESWQQSLERFDQFYWPLFKARGIGKEAAYLYWMLNLLTNAVEASSMNTRPSDSDDGDEWKQK